MSPLIWIAGGVAVVVLILGALSWCGGVQAMREFRGEREGERWRGRQR